MTTTAGGVWLGSKLVLTPGAYTTSGGATSGAIDLGDLEGNLAFELNAALATAGTTPTLDGKLQHADAEGGSYADTGITFAQVTDAAGGGVQLRILDRSTIKRWIKYVPTIAGANASFPIAAAVVAIKDWAA